MGTTERRQREAAQRRKDIIDAARNVFWESGYDGATMPQIAAQAELAPGTLYLYFPSKDCLYVELLTEGYALLSERLTGCLDGSENPARRASLLIDAFFEFAAESPEYFDIMFFVLQRGGSRKWTRFSPEQARRLETLEKRCRSVVAEAAGQAGIGNPNGYAPPVNAIWSMLAGVVFYFRKKKYFNDVAAEAKKLLLTAVFGQAAAAEGENDES